VLESEGAWMVEALGRQSTSPAARRLSRLTSALSSVIDDYMIVSFVMLDPTDEDSIEDVLAKTDHTIQYGRHIYVCILCMYVCLSICMYCTSRQ
jgi:hypothetical protein